MLLIIQRSTGIDGAVMKENAAVKPFTNIETSAFCGQIAMLLKAGISSEESLGLMLSGTQEGSEKEVISRLQECFAQTGSFSQACKDSGYFPDYLVSMVRIGEETGTLDDVLTSMESYYSREAEIQSSIRNAVTFPLLMIALMAVVIIVLLTKVFPLFNQAFLQLGSTMSGLSAVLLDVGNAISRYANVLIVLLVCIGLLVLCGIFTDRGRKTAERLLRMFPFMRKTLDSLSVCRFANGMALTLGSGLLPQQSLKLTEELIDDPAYRKKIDAASRKMDEGADLYEALQQEELFPGLYNRMLLAGFRAGNTEEVMEKIARLSSEAFETRIFSAISSIEPMMVVILSVIVGIILLSVMLPLTGIMSGL